MVEVAIPVYKARDTLPQALNSLLTQTKKHFITCLSIDGDGDTYKDIIDDYRARGLKIRVLYAKENGGPGMARQAAIDTTQCDYIMFLDADDMLMPQAVRNLYDAARYGNYDILRSGFLREEQHKNDMVLPADIATITWTHGKIYKVAYLRKNNIRFLDGLRTDEDAHFNLIAWNCTKNRGQINDTTYLWRDYKNSLTRREGESGYFRRTFSEYIRGQVEGMKRIYQITGEVNHSLFSGTFVNIYTYYQRAVYYGLDLSAANEHISSLKSEPWLDTYLNEGQNWVHFAQNITCGAFYDGEIVYFYKEPINLWVTRLLRNVNN